MPSLSSPSTHLNIPPDLTPYTIPTSTYISTHSTPLVGVVSAAVIIRQNKVLLLQRAPFDDCPNLWEVPGGAAHPQETILDCLVRELHEETGLRASGIPRMLGEFEWDDSALESNGGVSERRGTWKIFMFLVTVEEGECLLGERGVDLDVRLDPNEHQRYVWVEEEEKNILINNKIKNNHNYKPGLVEKI
ncbi:hypothetical protein BO78DRAFT_465513 [Aspergillus sclerotiicarbonarius CBS 121057]|uniref:Nudix hydrolase domain-containing protein n=1 Tax=Aspergillus sclerotiicarbonarius (strain CBS 121057 / IBT 28362) TaxID=1448318 RepID=A0A319FNY7_ASPSB|nr:hypothetical protein BO78DRAFT_465513 [Aspergillus sclerotiicarbonarius CBS 121057]